jgi:hypothetical protein
MMIRMAWGYSNIMPLPIIEKRVPRVRARHSLLAKEMSRVMRAEAGTLLTGVQTSPVDHTPAR